MNRMTNKRMMSRHTFDLVLTFVRVVRWLAGVAAPRAGGVERSNTVHMESIPNVPHSFAQIRPAILRVHRIHSFESSWDSYVPRLFVAIQRPIPAVTWHVFCEGDATPILGAGFE
jgi:hypothetical protein